MWTKKTDKWGLVWPYDSLGACPQVPFFSKFVFCRKLISKLRPKLTRLRNRNSRKNIFVIFTREEND